MKVEDAVLCANCDEIYNGNDWKCCPMCASNFHLSLRAILNRRFEQKRKENGAKKEA